MKTAFVLFLIFLSHFSFAQEKFFQNAKRVKLVLPDGSRVLLSDEKFKPLLKKWSSLKREDPNSKTLHTYEGFYLKDFLPYIQKTFEVKEPHHLVTEASDGYKVTLSRDALESKNAFIAFHVQGVPKGGLYSQYLKRKFKWQPAYIIAGGGESGVKVVSPYQIKKLTWHEDAVKNPVLSRVSTPFQRGAEIYVETCSKCHRHKGFGGRKAPAMRLVLRKWQSKSDGELKAFLRAPQKTVKRKIQMSAFQGSDEDLEELIKFLRSVLK